jgi:hypothetical protein
MGTCLWQNSGRDKRPWVVVARLDRRFVISLGGNLRNGKALAVGI